MTGCVLFSTWMPRIERADSYIKVLEEKYDGFDFYIGVNPSAYQDQWIDMLLKSRVNVIDIKVVDKSRVLDSDASGFQLCLDLYRKSSIEYDYCYFIHTKGVSYSSNEKWNVSMRDYFIDISNSLDRVKEFLDTNQQYGGWCHYGRFQDNANTGFKYVGELNRYFKSQRSKVLPTSWLMTHYVIRDKLVRNFVNKVDKSFFNDKLVDRYWFESCFPLIIDFQNQLRYIEKYWEKKYTDELWKSCIDEWNSSI